MRQERRSHLMHQGHKKWVPNFYLFVFIFIYIFKLFYSFGFYIVYFRILIFCIIFGRSVVLDTKVTYVLRC